MSKRSLDDENPLGTPDESGADWEDAAIPLAYRN
jgi:hypothetical protein